MDPAVALTLHEIPELGFIRVGGGSLRQVTMPRVLDSHGAVIIRWAPTLTYLQSYASHHPDWEGEFFLTIYDAWREYSTYVPHEERKYVPWSRALNVHFRGHGALKEPRFIHRHPDPSIYPVLCRPVLTYNRHLKDVGALLIPDAHFLMGEFDKFREKVSNEQWTFATKPVRDVVYWRGAANIANNKNHIRMQAVKASRRMKSLDASFDFVDVPEQLKRAYLLDLDGYASAWSALYWKMLSHSVVVKMQSGWEQWYYDSLVPNKHYVPIDDLRSVPRVLEWCNAHPENCAQIADEATRFASKIVTMRHAIRYYTIH
jgi:hypothetical protein